MNMFKRLSKLPNPKTGCTWVIPFYWLKVNCDFLTVLQQLFAVAGSCLVWMMLLLLLQWYRSRERTVSVWFFWLSFWVWVDVFFHSTCQTVSGRPERIESIYWLTVLFCLNPSAWKWVECTQTLKRSSMPKLQKPVCKALCSTQKSLIQGYCKLSIIIFSLSVDDGWISNYHHKVSLNSP